MSQKPASNEEPFVSVIIPTHNRCDVLEECMKALVHQTFGRYEVIIVDDASTDDTPELIRRLQIEHAKVDIRYIRQETHQGANPARNRGIAEATGNLIAFADSDCIAAPDWIERLVAGFSHGDIAAVVGMVHSPDPRNIYDLALKGTHRVPGPGPANRIVGGNACVRRELLLTRLFDEDRAHTAVNADGTVDISVSGRGDEEGLFLALRADGYAIWTAPDAEVYHERFYCRRSFFRQAWRGGRSAARLVYKYHLWPRLDMLPFMLTYATIPLALWSIQIMLVPLFFFAAANAAITYNELVRKGKTIRELARVYPLVLAFYLVRSFGYLAEAVRLRLGQHDMKRTRLGKRKSSPNAA